MLGHLRYLLQSEFKVKHGETTTLPSACSPNDWLKEDEQGLDEHGGVHDVQGLDVLLVPVEAERELRSRCGRQGTELGP